MRDGPFLFLDIDGVLNSVEFAMRTQPRGVIGIDPQSVVHLQRIVDETDCQIVLSSTWRIGRMLSDIRGKLIEAGMRHPCPLIDRTPLLPDGKRGDEVKEWLDAVGYEGAYVCIDDDSDFLPGQPLVQTSCQIGITAADADRCIEILKRSPLQHSGEHKT